jgi:hypothetical protein
VDIAKLNNYYHVINSTCDRSQTEAEPKLAQICISANSVPDLTAITPAQ